MRSQVEGEEGVEETEHELLKPETHLTKRCWNSLHKYIKVECSGACFAHAVLERVL